MFALALIQTPSPAADPVGQVVENGETQVVKEFEDSKLWVREDLWVETEFDSDGDGKLDRMHVAVTRPRQTESDGLKVPAIYISSPYFGRVGGDDSDAFWNPRHEIGAEPPKRNPYPEVGIRMERPVISNSHIRKWVPRGFGVVHSSSPGTGLSEGCPTVGAANESLAPKAVVDWLCGRAKGFSEVDGDESVEASWCTGKVGMTGTSYNGTLALAAATTGVEGLEAIIPVAPNTSYYHYYRSNGLVRHPGGYMGEDIDVLYDFIQSNQDHDDYCDCEVREKELQANLDRITGDYNEFWKGRDYVHQLGKVRAAVLMSHGFNDWNVVPEHSYRISKKLKEMGVPTQIYYHQAGHGGEPPMTMMNRWFTHYLLGVDNGVENDPRSFIVREDKKRDEPTAYADYPHPDAEMVTFYGVGQAPEKGLLSQVRDAASIQETLVDNFSFDGATLAQADITDHRLIYVSPELKEDLHLSGTPSVTLRLASSKPAVNLSVWLVSLPWNKSSRAKIT
ncbi:MAG: Xaa-Pro dipeptidyl-peptidase, partial [Planctomycetota bacterium]